MELEWWRWKSLGKHAAIAGRFGYGLRFSIFLVLMRKKHNLLKIFFEELFKGKCIHISLHALIAIFLHPKTSPTVYRPFFLHNCPQPKFEMNTDSCIKTMANSFAYATYTQNTGKRHHKEKVERPHTNSFS